MFPDAYEASSDALAYAYFTRSLMWHSTPEEVRAYVTQMLGMDPDKPTLVADIGMYGSIEHELRRVLPNMEFRFMISKNPGILGYIHDGKDRHLQAIARGIPGNPAVHFLEDTFSGTTSSPKRLVPDPVTDNMVPEMLEGEAAYGPAELMKRKYATLAFGDYVSELEQPPTGRSQSDIDKLDAFLQDTTQYQHLMVPHIR